MATKRPLSADGDKVRAVNGSVIEMVSEAKELAGGRDVYLDGGALIRSALESKVIDEITINMAPVIMGRGIPLFAGALQRHQLELLSQRSLGGGFVELRYAPNF